MNIRVTDAFTASLERLAIAEQAVAQTTAFDLQAGPPSSGLSFYNWTRRVTRASDRRG